MPEQAFDTVEDGQGNVLSSVQREVSDEEIRLRDAPKRLRQAHATLEQWAADAATAHADWPTMTQGQKDAALRETIQRLGIFFDRMADLVLHQYVSR